MILAIETSCDESSVALLDQTKLDQQCALENGALVTDLISSQVKLHEPYGGVVPELAAREHLKNLPLLVNQALRDAGLSCPVQRGVAAISAIAVTQGPGLKGCLLVGLCYAKALSFATGIPLVPLNHIESHIHAVELLGQAERIIYPALALVVSGGHTLLVAMPEFRHYQLIAQTRDDAAGEAFDKSAALLELGYPGGPELARCASGGDPCRYVFPVGVAKDPNSFSFSGLKTAISRTISRELEKATLSKDQLADLCASIEWAIVAGLVDKTAAACATLRPRSLVLTGGVAANQTLRQELNALTSRMGIKFCVPPARWCTDNGAMVAMLAARIISRQKQIYTNWQPTQCNQKLELGPGVPADVTALPRWPLVPSL